MGKKRNIFKKFPKSKKFNHGLVKRIDGVGKFGGKILKQQSDTISGAIGNLSNPIVLIGALVVAGFVAIKML